MRFSYKTKGVCSSEILLDINDDIIEGAEFFGGCNGNLKAIGQLVRGMNIDEVIDRVSGIKCGFKNTSCPAQLADALREYKSRNG